jgi:hypothetical protein
MRAIANVDTLQIHTTNACVLQCAGCTHLCGHHKKPFMMTMDEFKKVIDSLAGYPRMIGIIGGEPLLVPWAADQFRYMRSKFPREQLGLWSTFLCEGQKYKDLAPVICETFGNILLNDHTLPTTMHAPVLMASGEFFADPKDVYLAAESCWVQNSWSPGITNKGAFFCEVAGELDQLFDGPGGWDVSEPGWWKKTPKDYAEQIERSCSKCGCAVPFKRRCSRDDKCDVSEGMMELLRGKSRKVDSGQVYVHKTADLHNYIDDDLRKTGGYPFQPYKQEDYRRGIAARYGIGLTLNERGYLDPHLLSDRPEPIRTPQPPPLFKIFQETYGQ